jgi:hypothetical protein
MGDRSLMTTGVGTEVELRLPAGAVYAASRRPSWMSRLLAFRDTGTI